MTENRPQVKVVKVFNAPAEKVFDAWLDPKLIDRWMFGPKVRDEKIVKLEANPVKGGTFSFVVRRDGEELNHLGTYLELDRPQRLVFTWGIEGQSEEESTVTIDIVSTETGCRLTLVHELDPKWAGYADRTRESWRYMLNKLEEVIS